MHKLKLSLLEVILISLIVIIILTIVIPEIQSYL